VIALVIISTHGRRIGKSGLLLVHLHAMALVEAIFLIAADVEQVCVQIRLLLALVFFLFEDPLAQLNVLLDRLHLQDAPQA